MLIGCADTFFILIPKGPIVCSMDTWKLGYLDKVIQNQFLLDVHKILLQDVNMCPSLCKYNIIFNQVLRSKFYWQKQIWAIWVIWFSLAKTFNNFWTLACMYLIIKKIKK